MQAEKGVYVSVERNDAQGIFDRIGDGHRNAVKRPWNRNTDRSLRAMIEFANHNGDCIISGENGYYRPIPTDRKDQLEYKAYMAKERSKVRKMQMKETCMVVAYEARKAECGL